MRNSTIIGRIAAVAALAVALVAVGVILLSSGSGYQVRAIFQNASQIVTGDLVEVAGNKIGTVSNIALTGNGQAQLTLTISNGAFNPLRQGTTATVRSVSLSGIANRYVDLRDRAAEPARDRQQRRHPGDEHDQRGRPRPALQHAQRPDPQGPSERVPRVRFAVRGRGQGRPGGVGLSEPRRRRQQHAVPRDQPQHGPVQELPRQDQRPGDQRRAPERRSHRSGRAPVDDDRRARRRARPARPVAARAARLHATREHDVREPAQRARRPDAAGQRVKAGRAEAREALAPAAPARRGIGSDRPRPVTDRPPAGPEQRPDGPDAARRAARQRDGAQDHGQRQGAAGRVPADGHRAQRLDPGARCRAPVRGRSDRLVRGLHAPGHAGRQRRLEPGRAGGRRRLDRERSAQHPAAVRRPRAAVPVRVWHQRPQRAADDRAGRPLPGLDGARRRVLPRERLPL